MRLISAVLCCLVAGLSLAQATGKEKILEVYGTLKRFPALTLTVEGAEANGNTTIPYDATYNWFSEIDQLNQPVAQLDSAEYRDNKFLWQTVADGVTLWNYNPKFNEYASSNYGAYGAQQPATYHRNLVRSLYATARGPAVWASRLLQDLYGSESGSYSPWSPGAVETVLEAGDGSWTDALTGRDYTPTPTRDYVIYELGDPVRRSIVFERRLATLPDNTQGWTLSAVYVGDQISGKVSRLVDLVITPVSATTKPDLDFVFSPPAGSKSVSGSRVIR